MALERSLHQSRAPVLDVVYTLAERYQKEVKAEKLRKLLNRVESLFVVCTNRYTNIIASINKGANTILPYLEYLHQFPNEPTTTLQSQYAHLRKLSQGPARHSVRNRGRKKECYGNVFHAVAL